MSKDILIRYEDGVFWLPLSLLRLHLAGMMLQGMLQSPPVVDRTKVNKSTWCGVAYDWADALLAEHARREGE